MVKVKGFVDLKTVGSLKGVLDFYNIGPYTIIRTWPKNKGKSQTPNSIPWQGVFKCFHENRGGMWLGGLAIIPSDLKGKGWTSRDYLMHLWYGKNSLPPGYWIDRRPPWPPTCPDPLHRMAIWNTPTGTYSIFSGLNIFFTQKPPRWCTVRWTYDLPRYRRGFVSKRGLRHEVGVDIIPPKTLIVPLGARYEETSRGNMRANRFVDLDRRIYFFMTSNVTQWNGIFSTSPWFVARVVPGPGGGEFGATVDGPYTLRPYHIDHPDRPLA